MGGDVRIGTGLLALGLLALGLLALGLLALGLLAFGRFHYFTKGGSRPKMGLLVAPLVVPLDYRGANRKSPF